MIIDTMKIGMGETKTSQLQYNKIITVLVYIKIEIQKRHYKFLENDKKNDRCDQPSISITNLSLYTAEKYLLVKY
jgi:hypothetical protein